MEACGKAALRSVDEELEKTGGICLWQLHIIHAVHAPGRPPVGWMPTLHDGRMQLESSQFLDERKCLAGPSAVQNLTMLARPSNGLMLQAASTVAREIQAHKLTTKADKATKSLLFVGAALLASSLNAVTG